MPEYLKNQQARDEDAARFRRPTAASYAALTSADAEQLRKERDEARRLVTEANNSLYGSQGYFHSLNGADFDPYHLARGIEDLKRRLRESAA